MKKKTVIIAISVLVILWCAVFVTDYVRCSSLKEPLFVIAKGTTADDGGSGIYQGLGYSVEVQKRIDAEYGACVTSVKMEAFGRVIAASIE